VFDVVAIRGRDRQPSVFVSVQHRRHDRGAVTVSRQAFDVTTIRGRNRQPSVFDVSDRGRDRQMFDAVTTEGP
jgi:hypothetical protein